MNRDMIIPEISFVVPVHNNEDTISRCLDSLINQTFNNIEIILINNASIDKTEEIIKKYVKKDSRIIYHYIDIAGVSNARNLGINIATSNYLLFVDADDYVELNFAEIMIGNIHNKKLVVCNINLIPNRDSSNINCNNTFDELLNNNRLFNPVWNKLFDLSVIKQNNLLFRCNISYLEDYLFNIEYISLLSIGNDINILWNKHLYNYCINDSSVTQEILKKDCSKALTNIITVIKSLQEINLYKLSTSNCCTIYKYLIIDEFLWYTKLGIKNNTLSKKDVIKFLSIQNILYIENKSYMSFLNSLENFITRIKLNVMAIFMCK